MDEILSLDKCCCLYFLLWLVYGKENINILHSWSNLSLQVVFLFNFIRPKTCKLTSHTILFFTQFSLVQRLDCYSGPLILIIKLNGMFYKAFPRPWVGWVHLSFFVAFFKKILTLHLCVQRIYSSWIVSSLMR